MDHQAVKVYSRYMGLVNSTPPLMLFDDGCSELLVDYSFVESVSCEKGEWYRLLGTMTANGNRERPIMSLNLHPHPVAGFDFDTYDNLLEIREEFLFSFDSLLAYASKHK